MHFRYTALAALLALMFSATPRGKAAVVLGLHEAQLIVEHTPDFMEASKRGQCPQLSDGMLNGNIATFVVRGGCRRFSWIADLYVDVKTGIVTTDGGASGPVEINTAELAELRSKLFAMRAETQVTRSEATCLLGKSPPALSAGEACRRIKMIREDDGDFRGSIEDACARDGNRDVLLIDRYEGLVSNSKTGEVYKSAELESIRQNLLTAHSPVRLTVEDAKRMAVAIPDLKDAKCLKAVVDPDFNADEVWLQVSHGCGESAAVVVVSVNLLTGAMQKIGPNTAIDSPELRLLRQELLVAARSRKAAAAKALAKACR